MTKSNRFKIPILVTLLLACLTLASAAVFAAQESPSVGVTPAANDSLPPSLVRPPVEDGVPSGPKPSDGSPVPAGPAGTSFQDSPTAPVIDVWYGLSQTFGPLGNPNKWINIVGNVSPSGSLKDLTYSLNGGPEKDLNWGPGNPRLVGTGDFNIEIDYLTLNQGNNTVTIKATNTGNETTTANVTVNYQPHGPWTPGTYVTNFAGASEVSDVANVIDGHWTISQSKARTTVSGYDRLLGIGDLTWQDYTVTAPVIIHSVSQTQSWGVGVIVRWPGHYDDPNIPGVDQPLLGWRQLGALGWHQYFSGSPPLEALQLIGNGGIKLDEDPFQISTGVEYRIKLKVTSSTNPATYQFKMWQASQAEPPGWNIEEQGKPGEPASGGVVLLAHRADVSFGNITVDLNSVVNGPTCYTLSLSHTGQGTDPVPSPSSSPGCGPGQYTAGATINLTAAPAADWHVSGWSGTNNNGSTATSNSVTMPASNHSASVAYEQDNEPPPEFDFFVPFVIDGFNP